MKLDTASWDIIFQKYCDKVPVVTLAKQYKVSRDAIYKQIRKRSHQRSVRTFLNDKNQIAHDNRYSMLINLYNRLNDAHDVISNTNIEIQKLNARLTSIFAHVEDMKISLRSLHDEHIAATIADLRGELKELNNVNTG